MSSEIGDWEPIDKYWLAHYADMHPHRRMHCDFSGFTVWQLAREVQESRAEVERLRAEVERLRNALKEIRYASNIFGDSNDAQTYISLLNDIWKIANDALPEGGPS